MSAQFLKQRGGYRKLKVYRVAEIIYDITYHFTAHYLSKGDRTIDQMTTKTTCECDNSSNGHPNTHVTTQCASMPVVKKSTTNMQ